MQFKVSTAPKLEGVIDLPGDKSITQRAMLLNSIATGQTTITNHNTGSDALSMFNCLKHLGADIKKEINETNHEQLIKICGNGPKGLHKPKMDLNAENSGTTMRLLAGLLSGQPFDSVIDGDLSLRSRPMKRILEPLSKMGAKINGTNNNTLPPISIHRGNLKGIKYSPKVASAQVKSCLLIAGLFAEGTTVLYNLKPSRDHTERMLKSMGANIVIKKTEITIQSSVLQAKDIFVPGDISAASFWLVAGSCHKNANILIKNVGINPSRIAIIKVLQSMGARIKLINSDSTAVEPLADIKVESSQLNGVTIQGSIIPEIIDEIPILALAGSCATGQTIIKDAQELKFKESDRIASTVNTLRKLGADINATEDGMVINGSNQLYGNECDSLNDHRIAMLAAISGLIAEGTTTINNFESVDVSYPKFRNTLDILVT
jgi:3-phosphoshikimate 1-carboxyvinyltransferase